MRLIKRVGIRSAIACASQTGSGLEGLRLELEKG
jgi:hypothetical protein